MAEILHQLIGSLSHYLLRFYTSQVVQDFFHQQYLSDSQRFPYKQKWIPDARNCFPEMIGGFCNIQIP